MTFNQSGDNTPANIETYNDVTGSQINNTVTATKSTPPAYSELNIEKVPEEVPSIKEGSIATPNLDRIPIAGSPFSVPMNEYSNSTLKDNNKLINHQENKSGILRIEAGAGGKGGSGIEADDCIIEGCEGTGGNGGNGGGLNFKNGCQGTMNIEAKYGEGGPGGSGIKAKGTCIKNSKGYGGQAGQAGQADQARKESYEKNVNSRVPTA